MGQVIEYSLPLFIESGVKKKRRHYLNLNLYRNMPFHLNNNLKKEMKKVVTRVCPEFKMKNYRLEYELHLLDKRLRDISNVCCIIDKYQCDALVELGYVPEDNYNFLRDVRYKFGSVDTENPRCIVRVIEEDDNV